MRKTIGKKLIVAIIATLSLSLVASIVFHTPVSRQDPNVGYLSFSGYFMLFLLMIAPVIFTAGIIFSILVDRKVKGISKSIPSYIVGGAILGFIYYLVILSFQSGFNLLLDGTILFTIIGGITALWFLVVQIITEPLFNKLNFN